MSNTAAQVRQLLDSYDIDTLQWIANNKSKPPALEIFAHHGSMNNLRQRGCIKHLRRNGWTDDALTHLGRQVLDEEPMSDV